MLKFATLALLTAAGGWAQYLPLDATESLESLNSTVEATEFRGKKGVRMTISDAAAARMQRARPAAKKAGEAGRIDVLAFLEDVEFSNGTIELELAGEPAPGAQGGARGFVGLAFRVQPDKRTYDAFYLRPTNGRADDQERRNHTVQYISHPEYPWYRFRETTPSKYETYADIEPGKWIPLKIEVQGDKARAYVNGAEQPTLIVNDLKSGADGSGRVALWIEGSTVAHFRNLRITKK